MRDYATAWFGGAVSALDVAARKMTGEVPVGVQNHNVILNPDQTRAWVTHNNGDAVSVNRYRHRQGGQDDRCASRTEAYVLQS